MGEALLAIAQGVLHAVLIVVPLYGALVFLFNYAKWLDLRYEQGRQRDRDAHRRRFAVSLVITVVAVVLGALLPRQP